MQFPLSEEDCIKKFREYSDSVVILAALYRLFKKNAELGKYVGIELKLHSSDGKEVEPDFIILYEEERRGLLFELKWSVSDNPEYLEKELEDMERYFKKFIDWKNSTKKVDEHDVVLICSLNDIKKVINLVQILCNQQKYSYLKSNNFSIWGWSFSKSKDVRNKEELRLERFYGKTGNNNIEKLLDQPGGILVSDEVLQFIRFQFFFIKQKPPVSYTIATIIQHILNPYPSEPWQKSFTIDLDSIMIKCEYFFPSWRDYDKNTKQIKRYWVSEALRYMNELDIIKRIKEDVYEVPIPIYRKKIPLIEALCKDLYNAGEKLRKKTHKTDKKKETEIKIGPLDKYFKEIT